MTLRGFLPRLLAALLLAFCSLAAGARAETWAAALSRMPLPTKVARLDRGNCVQIVLESLRSNHIVKAVIFMPGATDEFYLFRRAEAVLATNTVSLLDAVRALTNQTLIRATFRPPLLLLHTDEDAIEPDAAIQHRATADSLLNWRAVPRLVLNDKDWDHVQPILKRSLKVDIRPWRFSHDSWHFYRHSLAAWNLNGNEALEAIALAGKSRFIVQRNQVVFEPDPRIRTAASFDRFLR